MSKNVDSMLCENEEYKKKHVEAKKTKAELKADKAALLK